MDCSNKLKINEYVSINQLKKKLKTYLTEQGYSEFKPSVFAQGLVITLVMVLEEMVSDCIKNVTKDKTGLYTINSLVLKNLLSESDKYNFTSKYLKKYSSTIKYHESVFFNIKKVMDNLEIKHGSKLMIDTESKNLISYLILGLQYDLIDLALKIVKYSNRKTLNAQVLEVICSFMLSDEITSKIKLRLDSYNVSNNDNDDDEDEEEIEAEEANTDNVIVEDVENSDNESEIKKESKKNKTKIIEEVKEVKEVKAEVKVEKVEKVEEVKVKKKSNKKNKN